MDTITHGIAGALISKAVFGGRDLFPPSPMEKRRIATWALTIGAVFPDSDVLRDFFSRDPMLMITWHRSITHSLLCLPIWAVLLAALTGTIARWRKWPSPSFTALTGLYAIGILSHIFLDLVTNFGTMIWSPLEWSRPAWDILFIVDFTFTGIMLIPQLLAWAYEDSKHIRRRTLLLWVIFTPAPYVISRIGAAAGAPVSNTAILVATVLFAVLFFLPGMRGWGSRVRYENWNRAGLGLAIAYLLAATVAHRVAFARVKQIAAQEQIQVQATAALPLPPSIWHWDGLVLAPRGVYETRMDLSDALGSAFGSHQSKTLEHTYYPDAAPNEFIAKARQLPEVQKVFAFARFPVVRFHQEGDDAVVEILDIRFHQLRADRASAFTYQVRFSEDGHVLSQGWLRR